MGGYVELPVWLVVLALVLAAIGALDRVLAPSMRWVLRRRMERAVARLNERLQRPIQPFKLMARQDMIVRLTYDPVVTEAVAEHAHASGVPEDVAAEEARRYAREIVPGFSATVYFGFAARVARWLSRALYRVRIGRLDANAIAAIDPKATVIFVMNHRSNMDYVLVTWLASERSALSYAVGEWARVWPLSRLIRAVGAYFIRRRSRNALYRKVLARYVQMATAEGVTQAIFPEGGLSLDGRVGQPRLGLLNYIVGGTSLHEGRDVVFMPVALGYDRVLEDSLLVRAAETGTRRFRARPLAILRFLGGRLWGWVLGRDKRLGYAAVSFGTPLSLRGFLAGRAEETADEAAGQAADKTTEALAERLMAEVARVVPVLPVPLAAAALAHGATTRAGVERIGVALAGQLRQIGAPLRMPRGSARAGVGMGLDALVARGLVREGPEGLSPRRRAGALLSFYAAPVLQHLESAADAGAEIPALPLPGDATGET